MYYDDGNQKNYNLSTKKGFEILPTSDVRDPDCPAARGIVNRPKSFAGAVGRGTGTGTSYRGTGTGTYRGTGTGTYHGTYNL